MDEAPPAPAPEQTPRERSVTRPQLFLSVVVLVFGTSLLFADRSLPYDIDPFTNVVTAHALASSGSPILEQQDGLSQEGTWAVYGWVVDSNRGPVSQYPPGAALFAAPFYLLDTSTATLTVSSTNISDTGPIEVDVPAFWPAAVAGSLAVALAAGFTALTVARATSSWQWGAGSGLLLVLGTGLWLNGGYQLWQHGVAAMWLSLAVWLSSEDRWLGSGLAMGLAVLTRPPVAIISAILGIGVAIRRRALRPMLLHGLGASTGVAALLVYNYWLFDSLTVSGGYAAGPSTGPTFTERIIVQDGGFFIENLAGALFSPGRGLLMWSPFIAIAAFGIRRSWRAAPSWALASALGAVVLFIIQFRMNRYSGGAGFYSYRYPIESVTAAFPLLAVAGQAMWKSQLGRRALVLSAVAAVGLHISAIVDEFARV